MFSSRVLVIIILLTFQSIKTSIYLVGICEYKSSFLLSLNSQSKKVTLDQFYTVRLEIRYMRTARINRCMRHRYRHMNIASHYRSVVREETEVVMDGDKYLYSGS